MAARQSLGYVGTVERVERMRSSVNGNPRYRVHLTDGQSFPTAPDAMWAYGADNREWRESVVWFALEPCRLKSDDWQIAYARRVGVSDDPAGCVWSVWWGGASYGFPDPLADAEKDAYPSDVVDRLNRAYWNRDGETPAVDDTATAWIYLYDPATADDPYPDFVVSRAAGGEGGDGWDTWTVSPA